MQLFASLYFVFEFEDKVGYIDFKNFFTQTEVLLPVLSCEVAHNSVSKMAGTIRKKPCSSNSKTGYNNNSIEVSVLSSVTKVSVSILSC